MMTFKNSVWFSSDLHFGHDKEFLYGPRGFKTIREHDEQVIANWNSVVDSEDVAFILGDCMMGDTAWGMYCLRRLHGYKFIVRGNHDTDTKWDLYGQIWDVETLGYAETIKYQDLDLYLSHYPSATTWIGDTRHRRIFSFSGHTHKMDKFDSMTGSYNVALDAHGNFPVSADEVIEDLKKCYKIKL